MLAYKSRRGIYDQRGPGFCNALKVAPPLLDTVDNSNDFLIVDDITLFVGLQHKGIIGDGEEILLVVLYTQDDTNSTVRRVGFYLVWAIVLWKSKDQGGA